MLPKLKPLARLRFDLTDLRTIDPTPQGERREATVAGGGFDGERLSGEVLTDGVETHIVRSDGVTAIETCCALRTYDGAAMTLTMSSIHYARGRSAERLASGLTVLPHEYYLRASCRFETSDPRYGWVTRGVFVASGTRIGERAVYDLFSVA